MLPGLSLLGPLWLGLTGPGLTGPGLIHALLSQFPLGLTGPGLIHALLSQFPISLTGPGQILTLLSQLPLSPPLPGLAMPLLTLLGRLPLSRIPLNLIQLSLIPVAASALLSVTSGALSRRLSPRNAAALLTVLALATSLSTGAVLCLASVSALARQPMVAALGGWSLTTGRPLEQLPAGWSLLAGIVAAVLLASAVTYLVRATGELLRAIRVCRHLETGPGRLVITRTERPTAYTLPAGPGAIVISTGMLRLLTADERRALLAHEAAHLRHHHAAYLLLARLAAAANPLLRPLADQVRLAVELWADQEAAGEVGDSRIVARALARASLAAAGQSRGTDVALPIAQTHIRARVQALTGPPPRRHRWAAAVVLALTLASSAAPATLAWDTHNQVEIAQLAFARSHLRLAHRTPLAQLARDHPSEPGAQGPDHAASPSTAQHTQDRA
jgi:Zn-dependent protease with chaperone function